MKYTVADCDCVRKKERKKERQTERKKYRLKKKQRNETE